MAQQAQPTNVRFNRGGNIFNTLKYYAKSGMTARDLLFLSGDGTTEKNTTADLIMLADPIWVNHFLDVYQDDGDMLAFLKSEGGVPIVGTTRLSLMNPDFNLKSDETKLIIARGTPCEVSYGSIDGQGNPFDGVPLYDSSVSIFDILFATGSSAATIYGAADDTNIPTGQAVKAMIEQGIALVAGAMEYKGSLSATGARNGAGTSGGSNQEKGWVYIASTAIYGYAKSASGSITYTYSTTTSTSAGSLIFSCEAGDMVIVNNNFNAGVPFATTTVAGVSVTANCDVFERNLTGAVTAPSAFGAANRVILSNSANRDVVSLPNGNDKQVLTLVSGVPTWANPSSAGTVDLSIDESSNVFYSLLFCHEESTQSPSREEGEDKSSATVYYSRLAGFNPNTAKFGSADISVHRTGDLSEEAAWVSQSIFWNVLESQAD